ncbi:MAG: alpha/beta hydrolase [Pseudomonadales bacterium]
MTTLVRLYYATNRAHQGRDAQSPRGYGAGFSRHGIENLRFGALTLAADPGEIERCLERCRDGVSGDGEGLVRYFRRLAARPHTLKPFAESLDPGLPDTLQPGTRFGSRSFFAAVHAEMSAAADVVVLVHGFNVAWVDAVASAAALEVMLNSSPVREPSRAVRVVLFSWPSDGVALPFVSYRSDRTEARASGYALARGLLKLRDFLDVLADPEGRPLVPCGQRLHLLCHSMGVYVLEAALERLVAFTPGSSLPRLFEHIFLCAADVDDNALERAAPLGSLHELARTVTVYHHAGDKALQMAVLTKARAERLGTFGCARPAIVHHKVHQVDCGAVVDAGLVEHAYHLWGHTNADIRLSIDGVPQDAASRLRLRARELPNVWRLVPGAE